MAQELNNAGNGLKWNNVNSNYYSFDFYKSILNKFASVKDRGCKIPHRGVHCINIIVICQIRMA